MKQREVIKQLLKDNNRNQVWLAQQLGYAKSNGISQMLKRGNITVDTLYKICEALDYEITIQPKRRAGKRPQNQLVIEGNK